MMNHKSGDLLYKNKYTASGESWVLKVILSFLTVVIIPYILMDWHGI
ncbi:hypothetical protein K144313037_05900 [Clostridium tetani]|uniref:Uncharacterized protein n=1 Tax=Clostridium tetani TaxID=1513 RepID=A0ABC8EBA6_CLOTA|nr:hypothetical protein K144312032_06000 [Clostridium tetani]BDR69178.1 hypothetical protein K144313037_05900 [Clostridium tetani]BDR71873.1 hypothetical protein K144316041_05810 [Clostridium tetani]BDR77654.1 hypothetical protein K154307017_05870 [Clostridium tetani]BDR80349.1 hypothetical protein K234311028_05950 [Clostridium tetani]